MVSFAIFLYTYLMDKTTFIKTEFKDHYTVAPKLFAALSGEHNLPPQELKQVNGFLIQALTKHLKKIFLNKINKGKINSEYAIFLMTWLQETIDNFNQINIYSVQNGIVEARDLSFWTKPNFIFKFDKASAHENLSQVIALTRKIN